MALKKITLEHEALIHFRRYRNNTKLRLNEKPGEFIERMMDERHITPIDLCSMTGIHPDTLRRIRRQTTRRPEKYLLVTLGVGLELSLEELEELLATSGYMLSASIYEDIIIRFCFENPRYRTITCIEYVLEEFGYKLRIGR